MINSILIVDDEPHVVSALKRALIDGSYTIFTAISGAEGLEVLKNQRIKLVISDERMPGMSGSEFLYMVKTLFPDTVRIMLTGHASIEAALKAVNSGEIYRFFTKPWNDIELKLAILSAIERYDLEEENRSLIEIVHRQSSRLKQIEKMYPEIAGMREDDQGNLIPSSL